MKYFANYVADAVVREDDNGNRYVKSIETLEESLASKDNPTAWGIDSYGVHDFLEPITKKEYDTFGKKWKWSWITGEKITFSKKL